MNGATNCADASENIQRTNLEAKDVNASFKVITDTPIKEEAVAHLKKSMRKSGKNNVRLTFISKPRICVNEIKICLIKLFL